MRAIAEKSNSLKISWLKKNNCFIPKQLGGGTVSGVISWGSGENISSIGYTTDISAEKIMREEGSIRLYYIYINQETGEKEDVECKIRLTTTHCHYGGVRYWFICPLTKNGEYCGRQVGVLYSLGKYYGCRRCGNIAYRDQMKSGMFKRSLVSIPELDDAMRNIKRPYYKGKPTRKHLLYLKLKQKSDRDNLWLNSWLSKTSELISKNNEKGGGVNDF